MAKRNHRLVSTQSLRSKLTSASSHCLSGRGGPCSERSSVRSYATLNSLSSSSCGLPQISNNPFMNGSTHRPAYITKQHQESTASVSRRENPLSRLSEQIKRIPKNRNEIADDSSSVTRPSANWSGLELPEFKTLNTKSLLNPVLADGPQEYLRESSWHSNQTEPLRNVCRTLPLKSEIEAHVERVSRQQPEGFASRFYDQQYWHNKERGGPINRKYSAARHTLIQRYRIRQKTIHNQLDDIPLDNVNRALQYGERSKQQLTRK